MTVSAQTPYQAYTYAGSPTFGFPFRILSADDLQVSVDGVVQSAANYTVSGVGVQTGGSITYTGALTTGQLVELQRVTQLVRSTDYQQLGDFEADVVNPDFDRPWMAMQEQQRNLVQAIRVPEGAGVPVLPAASARKGTIIGFDSVTGALTLIAGAIGSALDLAVQFASAAGSSLVGFLQSGVSAIARPLQDKLREVQVSAADFTGWDPTGATVSDVAINAAIAEVVRRGGGTVWIPPGTSATFSTITPQSNVTIRSTRGAVSLKQVQPATNTPTGFYKASGAGSITNFHVRDIGIDGGRVASPANAFNHVFWFDCGAGESVTNISFEGIDFKNAQEDCIRVTASSSTSGVSSKITVRNCTAITETASLFEGTAKPTCDLLRLEQTWDYSTGGNGYGQVFFKHIEVTGCYGYQIRTLADIKRGCAFFAISNNRTQDMYDVHLSVDGSFDGVLRGNVGEVASTTTIASTFTDYIECQGERISIAGNVVDGGGKLVSGIFVTDYGRPQEIASSHNVGHQSVSVRVEGNIVKNVTTNGLRLLNALSSTIGPNTVEQCGASPATIESGTGRYASDGVTLLQAQGCHIGGVKSKAAVVGTKINVGAVGCTLAPCPDENGEDFIAMSSVLGAASTWGNFRSLHGSEYSPNPALIFSGTAANNLLGFDPDFYPAITAATTRPPSGAPGVIANDDSASVTRILWMGRHPNVVQKSRCYARFWMKQGTTSPASSAGIVFQELDSSGGFLSTTYYVIAPPASWTEYVMGYQVQNASAAALRVGLAIAGQPIANTGNTEFADFRVSRHAIGNA